MTQIFFPLKKTDFYNDGMETLSEKEAPREQTQLPKSVLATRALASGLFYYCPHNANQ